MSPERELWSLYEPAHVVCYFHPAVSGCLAEHGLHGFWNGYFAGRAGAMGAVGPGPVTALFFGFAPRMVGKALPKVWGRITPEVAVSARIDAASALLAPLLDDTEDAGPAVEAMVRAAAGVRTDGRALAAAWQGVPAPDGLASRLWWAATILREHRGDGHVLAATHAGLTGLEAIITHAASGRVTRETIQPNRGWSDDEWLAAVDALAGRGLVSPDGSELTPAGEELRQAVERDTDRLASDQLRLLGPEADLVRRVLDRLARAIDAIGALPARNPMGLSRPS